MSVLCLAGILALGSRGEPARAADAATPALMKVMFNPDGTIQVTLADGSSVGASNAPGTVIPPGLYNIHIDDTAAVLHWFRLVGPGVYVSTNPLTAGPDGEAVLNEYFEVTFQPGSSYSYQDDNAPATTRKIFSTSGGVATVIGNPGTTSGSSSGKVISGSSVAGTKSTAPKQTSSARVRFRGSLAASVSASGKSHLSFNGKAVESLKAGRYRILVVDQSRTSGFILQQFRKPATTVAGVSFTGKRAATIILRPGQWLYYPTFIGDKTYFIVTA